MKVGDRVEVISYFGGQYMSGATGTIAWMLEVDDWASCAVEFDEKTKKTWNCNGIVPSGRGRFGSRDELRLSLESIPTLEFSLNEAMSL